MRAETPAEQLFFTTVFLEGSNATSSWSGTGFVMHFTTTSGVLAVLVTNKHVLDGATALTVMMVQQGPDGQPTKTATKTVITNLAAAVRVDHPRSDVDIAVMPFSEVLDQMNREGRPPFYRALSPDLMLTESIADDLDALEEVTFVGYPNGLFDTSSFLPIARRGQTATPLQNDYRGAPAFLIDASVFGGSSGSPVFIYNRGMVATRDNTVTPGTRLIFIGVLAAVHVKQTTGPVHDLPARQIAVIPEAIDLGIVYKASAVQECVELLVAAAGLTLAASGLPAEPLN